MAMTGDQSKSLGVLKDSYIKKHGCNPVTLALYYNNTTGEKINLKFKKVSKSEENELKDNNTCINSLHRGTMDEDIVKEQTKHPSDTQTPMVLPGILANNHNCRLKKTPHMARPALNKHNKEFKNNRFADYETMLLKIIADLMTETEADLVKKHSGFCILNGLVVKSQVNIKDENIIVVNSKLAKEGGVLLDIPAEMINFCQINKNSKAISKLNIDEIKANIIIKPLTLVVGDSIIKIRICNKILVNGNDDIQNGGILTEPRLNYKNNASTQTDYSINNVVDDTRMSSSCTSDEQELFDVTNNVSLKSESTINSISVLSEILDKTSKNTSEINFAIDEPSLPKSNESNEQSSENLLIGTSIKLKSNKSNKLLNYNKNNLEHVKCINRLHNLTRSVLNEKNKTQVIDICEKLIKQCKLLQMRNELNIGTNFKPRPMCSFSYTKFTTKNPKKLFRENEIRNYPSYTIISTQNHKFGSDEMGKNSTNTNINHENNIKFTNNVKEGINIKENNVSNKENIVMFNEIYKKHGDSEDVNTRCTMKIEDQHEVDMFGNKAKLFSDASTMTESENVKNDIKVIPVKCIHNKSNLSSYPNRKTPKLCRRLKRHEMKHKIGIKKYLAQEINKFKKGFQKYDVSNDKIVRKQKIVDQISISQNSVCKTRSLKSNHKMGESSSTILIPMLSDPLDEIHNKFTLFGNPGGQFKHSTNFIEKIESHFEYSDSSYLTDYSSHMFSKPMFQKRIGSSMQEFSDTSTSVYSASDNVKVACDKCNKLCEVTVNKELGQLKLQLKSHICLVNSNQIQRFSREEPCSKNDNNETFSSESENSPLFEKNINILTKLPVYSKLIVPMNTHSENLKSNDSLQNKFIETSNSSFSTLPQSVRSSDKTDSKSKLTYKTNSSMEVFSNSQNRNFSSQSTDKKQEGLEDSVQIECEQCGKLRTLNVSKKNGNTILELISHVCLVDKNKGCGDLDKLTRKLIPLNQSALTSLDKNSDLEAQSEVVTNIVNYCSNVPDNNICSQENKAKSNPFSNLVDRKNSTDIPLENNLNKSKILESTTWERFLNQTGVRNSDELLIQIQNCIKTHLQIVGTSGCTIDSEHNKNYTTESIKGNSSTSRYNADSYRSDEKDLNEEMKKEKPVENELLNQNDLIIKTDVKENITTNEIENNFLQNSHFDVVTVFNREEFEDSSSHNVFNQGIKPKSVLYFNDNMKTDKDQEMKNCLNGIADISSTVRRILNPNETSMKKNNKVENGESVIQVLKIYNRQNISDNQCKLQNTNRLNGRENIKGIILDEPVPSPRYRESGLKSKPLKCKKKLKVKDSLCVIL